MNKKKKDPWSLAFNGDDSDKSSCNGSPYSNRSTSSSSESSSESSVENELSSDKENLSHLGSSSDIISKNSLQIFVQKIDPNASLDDQAYDMLAKIADAFVNDVSMRIVKLAKYRKDRLSLLDLEFTIKREYNLEFPNKHNKRKK
ncbi:hypothetical protein KR009_004878 [Drosophila setifemur]|nr:hypothetical protein KR009_004878 [Drosophila setifemur]